MGTFHLSSLQECPHVPPPKKNFIRFADEFRKPDLCVFANKYICGRIQPGSCFYCNVPNGSRVLQAIDI